jgi:hypothetical protein
VPSISATDFGPTLHRVKMLAFGWGICFEDDVVETLLAKNITPL